MYQAYSPAGNGALFDGSNINGSLWQDCTFNCGNATNHCWAAGGNWNTGSGNSMSSCTIKGYARCYDGGAALPSTAAAYWVAPPPVSGSLVLPAVANRNT